jgi:hypothetical protein
LKEKKKFGERGKEFETEEQIVHEVTEQSRTRVQYESMSRIGRGGVMKD